MQLACPTGTDKGILVRVTENCVWERGAVGKISVDCPNIKEVSKKRTHYLDKTTKKHYSLLCNMDCMTLRSETFPERNGALAIIAKVPPESSGMVEKYGGAATKRPRHNFQSAGTKQKTAAYGCAWHKNNKEFIILSIFSVIKLDTATKRCYNIQTPGKKQPEKGKTHHNSGSLTALR